MLPFSFFLSSLSSSYAPLLCDTPLDALSARMADLAQHSGYSANWSGLLDNLYVTAAIAVVCLVGYEIEVHIPRRRGRDGTYQRVAVRLWYTARRRWERWRGGTRGFKEDKERPSTEVLMRGHETTLMEEERKRLGDRESWEFG